MTYNQLISAIQTVLESHPLIKGVKETTPQEWLMKESQPDFPVCCFNLLSLTSEKAYQEWNVQFFFLDKSGAEGEFQRDVISDQNEIAQDILERLRNNGEGYTIEGSTEIVFIQDKYEDYLAGVSFIVKIQTTRTVSGCEII